MNIQEVYNIICQDQSSFFIYENGEFNSPLEYEEDLYNDSIGIISGSFNPLHDAHKALYNSVRKDDKFRTPFFEISLERVGKNFLSVEDLEKRLKQFDNLKESNNPIKVIVMYSSLMLNKAGILWQYSPVFYIGSDTARRMLDCYGFAGLQGIRAYFQVYDRIFDGKLQTLDTIFKEYGKHPNNFSRSSYSDDRNLLEMSSTKLRNQN